LVVAGRPSTEASRAPRPHYTGEGRKLPAASNLHDKAARAAFVALAAVFVAYLIVALWPRPAYVDITPVTSPDTPGPFIHVNPPSFERASR
jgi:hypothetical protein